MASRIVADTDAGAPDAWVILTDGAVAPAARYCFNHGNGGHHRTPGTLGHSRRENAVRLEKGDRAVHSVRDNSGRDRRGHVRRHSDSFPRGLTPTARAEAFLARVGKGEVDQAADELT